MGERRSRGGVFGSLIFTLPFPKGDGGILILNYFENKIYIFLPPREGVNKGFKDSRGSRVRRHAHTWKKKNSADKRRRFPEFIMMKAGTPVKPSGYEVCSRPGQILCFDGYLSPHQ